ncbi:MAG: helix-turn-helix transcriptional regulator [Gemmatimonadaceae bacterium]|nr:helix-turn-helix transcriptional regulator [Chitinophagaceae bacterium]
MKKIIHYLPGNLRFLRLAKGLRQDDMYEHTGLSRTTWSNYENAMTEPSVEGLLLISDFFGIALEELLMQDLSGGPADGLRTNKPRRIKAMYKTFDEELPVMNEPEGLAYVIRELRKLRKEIDSLKQGSVEQSC